MPRQSGSPRNVYVSSTLTLSPSEVWSAQVYTNAAIQETANFSVQGYGMFSIYITVTDPGNSTLYLIVMDETTETTQLAYLPFATPVTTGATRHYTFGAPGSTAPVVAARMMRLGIQGSAAAPPYTVTARIFGRTL